MKVIEFNKLIRDKIPNIIESQNKRAIIHIADKEEYSRLLFKKINEELQEFISTPNEEELADLLEVLYCLANLYHLDMQKIFEIKELKKNKRGGFENRIVLEKVIEE